jgi:transposase InsO family protein
VRQEALYVAISELNREEHFSVEALCGILDLNRASYYKWCNRNKSAHELESEELLHKIGYLYAEYNGVYGYRRITDELNARCQTHYNEKRIRRLMRFVGLKSVIRRVRPQYQRSTPEVTAENILNRDFTARTLNEKWVTDVTEFKYGNGGKLYLSAILDLKDKGIISFAYGRSNNNQLAFDTFDLAVAKYPGAHPLFHSDRGFQYTSRAFKARLDEAGMTQSMSRVGRCLDNGPMEGFWGILKCEMYYLASFEDYDSLVTAIESYIHFYNYERRQRKLARLAPISYRQLLENAA